MANVEQKEVAPRIVIVDNNNDALKGMEGAFGKEGWETRIVHDCREVMELLPNYFPDVLVLEVNSSDSHCLGIADALGEEDSLQLVSLVFVSEDDEFVSIALEKGGNDFIKIPCKDRELIGRINNAIGLKRLRQSLHEELISERGLVEILSHDISNPMGGLLNGIKRLEKLVSRGKEQLDLEKVTGVVEKLFAAYGRIAKLTQMVKDFQALITKKENIATEPVNLYESFKEVEDIFENRLEKKRITLRGNLEDFKSINVKAEPKSLIYTVLNNLISNAIKFSKPQSSIEVMVADKHDVVELKIKDTGVGMNDELKKIIFKKGVKTNRPGTEGEKGTGFGMPLAREYMGHYGGTISVSSVPIEEDLENHGTTMILNFRKA